MIYHALGLHGLGQCRSSARITLTYSRHICMAAAVPDVITKPVYGICRNGAASQTSESAAEWLRHAPRGAYTTARTVNRDKVFDLSFHINRMAESAALMAASDGMEAPSELVNAELLRPQVISSMLSAIRTFSEACPEHQGEIKLTLLSHWHNGHACLETHASPMPPRPQQPVKVQIKGVPRQNALAKDSEWVRDREILEKDKPADVNEVLLSTPESSVLEGTTSNFFALIDGELWTAGEGILLGTVRDFILQQCKANGVNVRLQAPSINDIEQWQGCMISSTSRLALPVDEVQVWDGTKYHTIRFRRDGLISDIDGWVSSAIASASERL